MNLILVLLLSAVLLFHSIHSYLALFLVTRLFTSNNARPSTYSELSWFVCVCPIRACLHDVRASVRAAKSVLFGLTVPKSEFLLAVCNAITSVFLRSLVFPLLFSLWWMSSYSLMLFAYYLHWFLLSSLSLSLVSLIRYILYVAVSIFSHCFCFLFA